MKLARQGGTCLLCVGRGWLAIKAGTYYFRGRFRCVQRLTEKTVFHTPEIIPAADWLKMPCPQCKGRGWN